MMRRMVLAVCVVLFVVGCRDERRQIRAVGSSTVFPFVAMAAERFGEISDYPTPIIEENGTGGGIALFCQGAGAGSVADFANASRRMKPSEVTECKVHGVTRIVEIPLGYDGIVVAQAKTNPALDLTLAQLFLALMRDVPKDGKLMPNPYHRWREIDPSLPDRAIEVYGPPPSSGTRDTLVDILSEAGCKLPGVVQAIPDEKRRKEACKTVRSDGAYIEGREDDNIVVMKLAANPQAIGIFGFSYLEQNASKVSGARIDGVEPTEATISEGRYKLARVLYTYAKADNLGIVPGIAEFAAELVSGDAIGPEGYLTTGGLIPLPAQRHEEAVEAARKLANGKD